ncbi:hypothetical protein VNO77_17873 [Canavalia gladiata]|uniref:Uncharacterized protein n=1 Tax=Canavalia gladiata TaxID=3824 RepID=A0AAN9QJ44_CANGL
MSFSSPQVESRAQFSPIPQHTEIEAREERFDWDGLVILIRLALVGILLIGLALRRQPTLDPIPPKFFLDSLHIPNFKVSEGEVSATWDLILTISNVMNCSNVNILRLDAKMNYKENETLAVITTIMPQYELQSHVFLVEGEERKRVHLKLSTTGWEENQPVVNDTVVQAIAEDMRQGVTSFSLHMSAVGEVELDDGWVETFTMHPRCSDLEVKFVAGNHKGEAATLIDRKPRECVGLTEWAHARDLL